MYNSSESIQIWKKAGLFELLTEHSFDDNSQIIIMQRISNRKFFHKLIH